MLRIHNKLFEDYCSKTLTSFWTLPWWSPSCQVKSCISKLTWCYGSPFLTGSMPTFKESEECFMLGQVTLTLICYNTEAIYTWEETIVKCSVVLFLTLYLQLELPLSNVKIATLEPCRYQYQCRLVYQGCKTDLLNNFTKLNLGLAGAVPQPYENSFESCFWNGLLLPMPINTSNTPMNSIFMSSENLA